MAYDYLVSQLPRRNWPERDTYVKAMLAAEQAHWNRVVAEHWSGPPSGVIREGFRRLDRHLHEDELIAALDGYAHAVDGWAIVFPDARETLQLLRERDYPLGLLSNTWWAADWHNADLATHGLNGLLDEIAYTSDLSHSKPHPSVFQEVASRLGVPVEACVMVGDRLIDDISGALGVGMRAVWKYNDNLWPKPEHITPTATITNLAQLPPLLKEWGGN
jgi:putative hydrolase of the HAD superfamily